MKIVIVALSVFFFMSFSSCRKDGNVLVFEGKVTLGNTSDAPAGIMLSLRGKIVDDNSYGREMELTTATAESDGTYHIEIDNVRASEFTLTIKKTEFFTVSKKIKGDEIAPGKPYQYNPVLYPKSYLKLHIENVYAPKKEEDVVTVTVEHSSPSCTSCCAMENKMFKGAGVDTVAVCNVYGNRTVHVKWIVNKGGEINNYAKDLECKASDTTVYTIDY